MLNLKSRAQPHRVCSKPTRSSAKSPGFSLQRPRRPVPKEGKKEERTTPSAYELWGLCFQLLSSVEGQTKMFYLPHHCVPLPRGLQATCPGSVCSRSSESGRGRFRPWKTTPGPLLQGDPGIGPVHTSWQQPDLCVCLQISRALSSCVNAAI